MLVYPMAMLAGWLGVSAIESATDTAEAVAWSFLRVAGAALALGLAVAIILWKTGILPAYFRLLGKSFAVIAAFFGAK